MKDEYNDAEGGFGKIRVVNSMSSAWRRPFQRSMNLMASPTSAKRAAVKDDTTQRTCCQSMLAAPVWQGGETQRGGAWCLPFVDEPLRVVFRIGPNTFERASTGTTCHILHTDARRPEIGSTRLSCVRVKIAFACRPSSFGCPPRLRRRGHERQVPKETHCRTTLLVGRRTLASAVT